MRIEVATVEEFCSELKAEAKAGRVWENVVRVRTDRSPQQEDEVTWDVGFWATALVKTEDGDYVLECGRYAGVDNSEPTGSNQATEWEKMVRRVAKRTGLSMRRGKIEVY